MITTLITLHLQIFLKSKVCQNEKNTFDLFIFSSKHSPFQHFHGIFDLSMDYHLDDS